MVQNEITKMTELLDKNGKLTQPGWCRTSLYRYSRKAIKANPLRIKEWDFYQIADDTYTIQMTFADISMGGGVGFNMFNRKTGERIDCFSAALATFGRLNLDERDEISHTLYRKTPGFEMEIKTVKGKRYLSFNGKSKKGKVKAEIELTEFNNHESLIMAVPFENLDRHFYLNKKMNCMPAKGYVKIGDKTITLNSENAFCVLDWGRGVWPYKGNWYWGNGSEYLPDGRVFGFEIGWGFGDMSKFTENTLFIDGKAHKIGKVFLSKTDYMSDWVFTSDDGRFEMTMTPEFDNYTTSRVLGVVGNVCHQVFGKWNGKVTLDDGEVIEIKDMIAFCENSDNRW